MLEATNESETASNDGKGFSEVLIGEDAIINHENDARSKRFEFLLKQTGLFQTFMSKTEFGIVKGAANKLKVHPKNRNAKIRYRYSNM